jgi:Zn-finger protein
MKEQLKQAINIIVTAIKNVWPCIKLYSGKSYGYCKIVACVLYRYSKISLKGIWSCVAWVYHHVADMFKKIPSELTYWHDGVLTTVHVDDFVELAPNLLQYRDSETGKRVKVKAEYPIKYILKEK